jgi:hypothetical protein
VVIMAVVTMVVVVAVAVILLAESNLRSWHERPRCHRH